MKSYRVNKIDEKGFNKIATIIKYTDKLSDTLEELSEDTSLEKEVIIIDTFLIGGLDEYRFIAFDLRNEKHEYIWVHSEFLRKANNILLKELKDILLP